MQINEDVFSRYQKCLLAGSKADCYKIVDSLIKDSVEIHDLYVNLFQRSLYEIGSLWEHNKISVAVEHVATAITESMLGLVYPIIFGAEHVGRTAVISCLANEYHQLGGKMVADIFELNGWDGYFLGANAPLEQLLAAIDDKQPELVALSLSVCFNFDHLYRALEAVRARYPRLPIMVGGQAFLWGGSDIGQRFSGVAYVATLRELERIIHASPDRIGAHQIVEGRIM